MLITSQWRTCFVDRETEAWTAVLLAQDHTRSVPQGWKLFLPIGFTRVGHIHDANEKSHSWEFSRSLPPLHVPIFITHSQSCRITDPCGLSLPHHPHLLPPFALCLLSPLSCSGDLLLRKLSQSLLDPAGQQGMPPSLPLPPAWPTSPSSSLAPHCTPHCDGLADSCS